MTPVAENPCTERLGNLTGNIFRATAVVPYPHQIRYNNFYPYFNRNLIVISTRNLIALFGKDDK